MFQFPDEATILQEWFKTKTISQLIGFENDSQNGEGVDFNFILSNGTRSTQRDEEYPTNHIHMIPADALHKIRSVSIQYDIHRIWGFSFFDKDGALLWKIGGTHAGLKKETVLLAENEVIVGVVAKLYPGCQSVYTDF